MDRLELSQRIKALQQTLNHLKDQEDNSHHGYYSWGWAGQKLQDILNDLKKEEESMENTEGYRLTKERLEEILRGEGVNEKIIAVMWPPPPFIPEWFLADPVIEPMMRDLAREYVRIMPEVFA